MFFGLAKPFGTFDLDDLFEAMTLLSLAFSTFSRLELFNTSSSFLDEKLGTFTSSREGISTVCSYARGYFFIYAYELPWSSIIFLSIAAAFASFALMGSGIFICGFGVFVLYDAEN